jgi:hypothetical protein
MESDGLDIGMSIPDEAGLILPELLSPSPTYLVLLSASCDPCRELAYELHRASLEGVANLVAVVSGVVNPKYRTVS